MRLVVAVIACLISVALSSKALAQDQACSPVTASGAGLVVECGNQLDAFDLSLSESKLGLSGIKREVRLDLHGRFAFACPLEPICANEPAVGGSYMAPAGWLSSSKDEQAIFQILRNMPWPGVGSLPIPSASCQVFDVSIDRMNDRAVCFDESVVIVAADDRVGFLLYFSQRDKPAAALKNNVLEMLPRFEIKRATGEVGLKRWLR